MELDYPNMISSIPLFARAAWTTLWIAASGIFLAGMIGAGCAFSLYLKVPFLTRPIKAYIEVSRNTPLLVQLFLLHFGLKVEALPYAVTALAFLGGGYMAEAFRAGLEAVERYEMVRHVVLPQALISAIPAIGANVIFLLKETSVVSVVAVTDIVAVAKDLISLYYETAEALIMLVIAYLVLLTPVCIAVWWLERKVKYAVFGR